MAIEVTRTSVHCEKSWHEFYRSHTGGARSVAMEVPFATMTQAFVTFACLGRQEGNFVELKQSQEIFIAPSFDRSLHVPVLVALAYDRLVGTGVPKGEALRRASTSSGFVPIVEGWAQGGVQVFKQALEDGRMLGTEVLLDLVVPAVKSVL